MAFFEHGRKEAHVIIRPTDTGSTFALQLENVLNAQAELQTELGPEMEPVFKRYYLSDATNQTQLLPGDDNCAVSVIQQAPLDGTKIALLTIFQFQAGFTCTDSGLWKNQRGQIWLGHGNCAPADSETMTTACLENFNTELEKLGASLKDNCIRTWFFVRDVDNNYKGVVRGRNNVFNRLGLTPDTHFIASTGIEGRDGITSSTVAFNACADTSLRSGQTTYLYGMSHLNPTYEYGVAFERGTAIDYADRRNVFISGTASIDNKGNIMHPGDIGAQIHRMLENIGVLLDEAECRWNDVAHLIVYVRDTADYTVVNRIFSRQLPGVPRVVTLAPVCRPGWLVETECMAIRKASHPEYAPF